MVNFLLKLLTTILISMIILSGCSDSNKISATETGNPVTVSVYLKTDTTLVRPALLKRAHTQSKNTKIIFTKGYIVLRNIKLISTDSQTSIDFGKSFQLVIPLQLNGLPIYIDSIHTSNFGIYNRLQYELVALTDSTSILWKQYPMLHNQSLYIEGYFNDDTSDTFNYTSHKSQTSQIPLLTPIIINESRNPFVTLQLPIGKWFLGTDGSILDPRIAEDEKILEDEWSLEVENEDDSLDSNIENNSK